ncbi:hypothetical protein LPJ38_30930 [Bradyrhizobium daqingense]|uniref:Uncharacterized protein n=1 Tax=Bradyrhizobium daqingense TaxID=993502 RepID=A0A562LPZ8_9BRAD|nr:hypothetical protein [Bradyrhizobium daqingense]TWI09682.1 hypothetical protein IQ17_00761 [Bradyrhizobium daqingense]UFS88006.1 hypothetical protein LPJ38_30930 [Bradyrhizobium daqingense]
MLLWLLDHCGSERAAVSKIVIRQLDMAVGGVEPERFAELNPPIVKPTQEHVELAARAWGAYRASTPQAWFDLLKSDLSLLPQLERCAVGLLDELPSRTTGLAATETRMLELISPGNVQPFDVFPGREKRNERRVYDYWEVGTLLDGLARCPVPAVAGLEEGPFTLDMQLAVSRNTSGPACRSPISGRRRWREKRTSGAIIRFAAVGVARFSPANGFGDGTPRAAR